MEVLVGEMETERERERERESERDVKNEGNIPEQCSGEAV